MYRTTGRLRGFLRKIFISDCGGVLIYVAFGLPILLGAMALSIDLGRSFILNTELKDFSDASALAGAAELDGRIGAMAAAREAALSGLSGTLLNVQAFATDGGGPNIEVDPKPGGIVFLRQLPADGTNFVAADTATGDADARFIFVKVVNRDVSSGLSRALGVTDPFETSAKSIAGFQAIHCRVPAMFMCNPLEADGTDGNPPFPLADGGSPPSIPAGCSTADRKIGASLVEPCLKGRQVLMKQGGGKGSYRPGNFGLLDCPSGAQGTNCVAPFIARAEPGFCVGAVANFRTGGAVGPVRTAMNTRFDIYENPFFKNAKSDSQFRPALNVVKGHTTDDVCDSPKDPSDPDVAMGYPRDKCFRDNNCPDDRWGTWGWQDDAAFGDGLLGAQYWQTNHNNPVGGGPSPPGASDPKSYSEMTRYEVYRWEIDNIIIPNNHAESPTGENAKMNDPADQTNAPQCYTDGTLSDPSYDLNSDPNDDDDSAYIDRRIFTLAAVNCRHYEAVTGDKLAGNESNVPVIGFIDFFLTQPVEKQPGSGGDKADIYGEVIGVSINDNGLREIVQLYR